MDNIIDYTKINGLERAIESVVVEENVGRYNVAQHSRSLPSKLRNVSEGVESIGEGLNSIDTVHNSTMQNIKHIFDSLNTFVNGQVENGQVENGQVDVRNVDDVANVSENGQDDSVESVDYPTFLQKIAFRLFNSAESFMNGPHGQMLALNCIFLYSRIVTYISQQFNTLCKSNHTINVFAGSIGRIVGFVSNLVSNHSHEPDTTDWLNESYVILAGSEGSGGPIEYLYDETYTLLENCIVLDPAIKENPICKKMANMYQSAVTNIILSPSKSEGLVILKYIDNYIFRKINRSTARPRTITVESIQFKQSLVKFLGVTYSHPKMTNKIDIEIPKSMCMVDNEILSPAFILRCLKYQSQSYVFDMNYEINIIDSNINSYKIRSHQYAVLGERDIRIIE
jgi:hypothetical protein